MKDLSTAVAAASGVALVVLGALAALLLGQGRSSSLGTATLAWLFVLVALVVAAWKVWGPLDADSGRPVPWAPDEPFATPPPERSRDAYPLSSDYLAGRIAEAGDAARSEGTVADGVAVVRPELRETLLAAMVGGTWDREEARRALATGEWTDDPVAAAVVDPDVLGPEMSLRERLEAWLFPEKVVRRRIRRTVQAIAEVADGSLPAVPGQSAPRSVPVLKPRLEELQRGADGRLQRAVDPTVVARGPEPPAPDDGPAGRGDGEWARRNDDGPAGRGDGEWTARADAGTTRGADAGTTRGADGERTARGGAGTDGRGGEGGSGT